MKAKANILCKLFDHNWQFNNASDNNGTQNYPPYNIVRTCERCHKKEVLINMPEYKWSLAAE